MEGVTQHTYDAYLTHKEKRCRHGIVHLLSNHYRLGKTK
jgi:hypothetical protein